MTFFLHPRRYKEIKTKYFNEKIVLGKFEYRNKYQKRISIITKLIII